MNKRLEFKRVCQQYNLICAYFFGSQAEIGEKILSGQRPDNEDRLSDLDLGVVFARFHLKDKLEVHGALEGDLEEIFAPFSLDLVFLQETNWLLQYEAICGRVAYAISDELRTDYEEKVLKFAEDWKYTYQLYQQEVMEAIKNGYRQFEYHYAL